MSAWDLPGPVPVYLGGHRFTHEYWAAGCLRDIGVCPRYYGIVDHRLLIRRVVTGWHPGARLPFRPKPDSVAVMMFTDRTWWTHLYVPEFLACFPELARALERASRSPAS